MVPKWKGRKAESSDENVEVSLDLYPGRAVLSVGGDRMMPVQVLEEMVAQHDNKEANGVSLGLQRQCCTAGRK